MQMGFDFPRRFMSKEIDNLVDRVAFMQARAMCMNIYGKPSNERDQVLATIIHELADRIGNKTLTENDFVETEKKLFAFVQAARQEWEIIES